MNVLEDMIAAAQAAEISSTEGRVLPCGCGAENSADRIQVETFPFGEDGTYIQASIPVIYCEACGRVHIDERAETARHAAVCHHQGLLSPAEISDIRKNKRKMSRQEFYEAFGIPPASMERWENGRLIQNRSSDTLLRGIAHDAFARLVDRRGTRIDESVALDRAIVRKVDGNVVWARFPALAQAPTQTRDDAEQRDRAFVLRRHG